MRAFSQELSLPMSDVRMLMSEADENEDGLIDVSSPAALVGPQPARTRRALCLRRLGAGELLVMACSWGRVGRRAHAACFPPPVAPQYREFVPLAVEVIETIYAKRRFGDEAAARQAEAAEETEAFLLHGMPREKLENTLRDMFNRADADGSGKLSRTEFQSALRDSGLGLTRQEINVLLAEVDENEDGEIDYEEFLPVCFNVLVEIVSKQLEDRRIPQHEAELRDFFLAVFRDADEAGEGRLPALALKAALQGADIGLSIVQLTALMVEAEPGEDDGLVDYADFASVAAGVVSRMLEVQTSSDRAAELSEARETGELSLVAGRDRADFAESLNHAIGALDPEARGVAPAEEVAAALSHMGLSEGEVGVVLQLGDLGDGTVDLDYVGRFSFDAIAAVAEQQMLAEHAADNGAGRAAAHE